MKYVFTRAEKGTDKGKVANFFSQLIDFSYRFLIDFLTINFNQSHEIILKKLKTWPKNLSLIFPLHELLKKGLKPGEVLEN